jgi:hypothetical protein
MDAAVARRVVVIAVCALVGMIGVSEQRALGASPAAPVSSPAIEGQRLNYNVYWRTASAGIATLRVESQPASGQLKITGTARSSRFVSTLYRVEDQFESLVSLRNFCSLRIMKQTNEGRWHRETIIDFSPDQQVARMQDRDLAVPLSPVRRTQNQTPACVQDVLSALFYMQTQPFVLGKTAQFPVHDGGKTYNVVVEIQQRETIKTDAGTFQTIRVEPKVFGGLFRRSGRLYVWYTDDDAHRLVQLKARISVGTITASLASTAGAQASSARAAGAR